MQVQVQIAVYDGSRLVVIVQAPAHKAWRAAVSTCKSMAYKAAGLWAGCDVQISGVWYRTSNRNGFICGTYRATSVRAIPVS